MAGSADITLQRDTLAPPTPAAAMWLPGTALNCYESDATRRSWLLTPGLLTQRIREAAGTEFHMRVLREGRAGDAHVREIEMRCGSTPWLFAHTRIPADTVASQPWLAAIGGITLGEALATRGDLTRSPFHYALLTTEAWVVARATDHAGLAPRALWVRRSDFAVAGAPFALYEVFLPAMGVRTPPAPA